MPVDIGCPGEKSAVPEENKIQHESRGSRTSDATRKIKVLSRQPKLHIEGVGGVAASDTSALHIPIRETSERTSAAEVAL